MNFSRLRMGPSVFLGLAITLLPCVSVHADDSASVYKAKCVACHGADGSGTAVGTKLGAHDLRSADVQKMSDAQFTEIIANGKNKMPAYGKSMKPDDVKALVAYIRTLAAKT